MSATNAFENGMLSLTFENANFALIGDATGLRGSTTAGSFYTSLHTADPGETGDQTTSESAYTNYARVAVARSTAAWSVASGVADNDAAITFPAGGVTGSAVTHFGIGSDSSGAGNRWMNGASALAVSAGVTPRLCYRGARRKSGLTAVLQRRGVSIQAQGELVLWAHGNLRASLHFVTALQLSAAMMVEARTARRIAKMGARILAAGVLHDAAADRKAPPRFAARLPKLLQASGIRVKLVGQIVHVHFGKADQGFAYQDAAQIAQWLRLRGREARNNAGERSNWAKLAQLDSAEAGELMR